MGITQRRLKIPMAHDLFQQERIDPTHNRHAGIDMTKIVHPDVIQARRAPDPQPWLLQVHQVPIRRFPEALGKHQNGKTRVLGATGAQRQSTENRFLTCIYRRQA